MITPRRVAPAGRLGLAALLGLAGTMLSSSPAAAALAPRAVSPTICVGVVVAYQGQATSYGGGSNTYCAKVPAGASGADVLSARARALGRPQPRYENGLLCAIDGFPATGCGRADPRGSGYDYWSHWQRPRGSAGWVYAQSGAFDASPGNGDQEGWSWVQGQSEQNAPRPPLVAFDQVCPPQRPTPSPAPAAGGGTGPGPHPETVLPATPPPTSTQPNSPATATGGPPGSIRAVKPAKGPAAGPSAPVGTPTDPTKSSPAPAPEHLTAVRSAAPQAGSGTRALLGFGLGAALITALGGAAWWRARSR
ncbi:MAG TPA: hypothetical protein VGN54_08305 [Mycobacteriales bacterium]|nr:hypothetical protein [Mycobacteriales bacterium]